MPNDDDRLFRRTRRDGSVNPVWYGWYYDAQERQITKSTRHTDRRAAARVRAQWERDAAEPDHARARSAVLVDAIELLLQNRKEQAAAGRKAAATFGFYQEKTGHWLRILGEDFLLAQLAGTEGARHVDRYITQRRSEWAVTPRPEKRDKDGKVVRAARPGRHVSENTISKELVALRAALKLAKRRGLWKGDLSEVLPVGFAPEYKPREHFLSAAQLEALLAELLPDGAARVAFTVATSAEDSVCDRAEREDVSSDLAYVYLRGTKRATRARTVPVVTKWQSDLLAFAVGRAQGIDGKLFESRTKFQQTLARACKRAGIPHTTPNDLRRTYSTWLRACGVPNELSAPTMGHKDTRMLDRVYARLPPDLLRARLLLALGVKDATEGGARCSAGAVNPSGQGGQIGRSGQGAESVTPGKLAPRAGFEPATHGLTVRCSAS